MISIIIASRNEGNEIHETVQAIVSTIDIDYEIIIVDDCSKEKIKESEGYALIRNDFPVGVQPSRMIGALAAKYDILCFFNARMRFPTKKWASKMVANIQKNKQTLFCTTSAILRFSDKEKIEGLLYGAGIKKEGELKKDVFMPMKSFWLDKKQGKIYDIPCVLGANYFIGKKYFFYLRGFEMMRSYGADEEMISLKSWAMGNGCKIDTTVEIGNIYYSEGEEKPWSANFEDFFYNHLLVAFVMLDYNDALNLLFKYSGNEYYGIIKNRILKEMPKIMELRRYINAFKKRDINNLLT
jgi:glycosyltransferase involved in cell wall biosynthesis